MSICAGNSCQDKANKCTLANMNSVDEALEQMPLTGAELLAALAEHERWAAVLALAVRRVETGGEWTADGSVSIAAWLRQHGRMSNRDAHRWVARGRFLDQYGAVADAAVSRTLSAGQVQALQSVVTRKVAPVLAEQQLDLVATLAPLTVADTETACQVWKQRAEAVIDDERPPAEPERSLQMARHDDGTWSGQFTLGPDAGAELDVAIRTASNWGGSDDTRTAAERRADAMFDICAFFNRNHTRTSTPRNHANFDLSIDASTLDDPEAVDCDGKLVDRKVADALLCDCVIHRIIRDTSWKPTVYGRGVYTVPRSLFRMMAARDGGCRFPGCDRPVSWTDAHHIHWWRRGGHTDYDNLVLLCSRHHHLVHQLDLELKLLPDARLEVTWPDGRHRTSEPRGRPPTRPRRR